jgi:hypothetical protein
MSSVRFYVASAGSEPLRQGEILGGVLRYSLALDTPEGPSFDQIEHPFVIVLSQDCDLAQDFRVRVETHQAQRPLSEVETKLLPNILVCELVPETELFAALMPGSDIKKRVVQNKDERISTFAKLAPNATQLVLD